MEDVEWDAEEYTPPPIANVVSDKWEGEDEEEEVKESWDDDDETKRENDLNQSSAASKKKKKKLVEIIAEKEKRKFEEVERRQKEKEDEKKNQSPEEALAEKLRLQKVQEDSDLQLATDLLGDREKTVITSLDAFDLSSISGLDGFRLAFLRKIKSIDRLEKKPYYITFLEDLCRDLCESLESEDIKRVTTVLNALYNEKVKASKPTKGKKKAAGKAKLNPGQGAIADDADSNYTYDEYDDFI